MNDPTHVQSGKPTTLLFGVGVTPTKPLVPTHLKGLIWIDTAVRAASLLSPIDLLGNSARQLWDSSIQTLRFWAHLDEADDQSPRASYRDKDDLWIGERYVEQNRAPKEVAVDVLERYRRRIEDDGWMHESARRLREMNSGFPPGASIGWVLVEQHELPTGRDAYLAEGRALEALRSGGKWIGGEFGLVPTSDLANVVLPHLK